MKSSIESLYPTAGKIITILSPQLSFSWFRKIDPFFLFLEHDFFALLSDPLILSELETFDPKTTFLFPIDQLVPLTQLQAFVEIIDPLLISRQYQIYFIISPQCSYVEYLLKISDEIFELNNRELTLRSSTEYWLHYNHTPRYSV